MILTYEDTSVNESNYLDNEIDCSKFKFIFEDEFKFGISPITKPKIDYIPFKSLGDIKWYMLKFYGISRVSGFPIFVTKTLVEMRKYKIEKLLSNSI